MSYNVTTCSRCGEQTYDPDYAMCVNEDCRLAPVSARLHLALLAAAGVLMCVLVGSL